MRIPTLLALFIIALLLGVGIYFSDRFQAPTTLSSPPQTITLANLSDSEASIIWQTKDPVTGLLSFGLTDALGDEQVDDRDQSQIQNHQSHIVSLTNLPPQTLIFYKIKSSLTFYPDNPLSFKTAPAASSGSLDQAKDFNKPIFGVVVNPDLTPAIEALVFLKIPGGVDQATLTSTAGNFLIPLINLRKSDLSDLLVLSQKTPAELDIKSQNLESKVKVTLPLDQPLTKVTLGQDSDFSQISSPSAKVINFDLNQDGKVNSVDLSILLESLNTKKGDPKFNPAADFDSDGVIDQKDVDLLKAAIK